MLAASFSYIHPKFSTYKILPFSYSLWTCGVFWLWKQEKKSMLLVRFLNGPVRVGFTAVPVSNPSNNF